MYQLSILKINQLIGASPTNPPTRLHYLQSQKTRLMSYRRVFGILGTLPQPFGRALGPKVLNEYEDGVVDYFPFLLCESIMNSDWIKSQVHQKFILRRFQQGYSLCSLLEPIFIYHISDLVNIVKNVCFMEYFEQKNILTK